VAANRCGRGFEERVELGLVEEVDVRVVVLGRRRLLDRPGGVGVGPALRDGELEDPIQVHVEVADRLHRQRSQAAVEPVLGIEACVDEVLDVVSGDLVDGLLREKRREVDPDLRLVVGEGRVGFATAARELLDAAVPTSATVIRSVTGGGAESVWSISSRSRASACVRVRPSRLPGTRIGPSERFTSRPRTYHCPYQRLPFSTTAPVPRGRRCRARVARGLLGCSWLTTRSTVPACPA
jgi:hypothetical protein